MKRILKITLFIIIAIIVKITKYIIITGIALIVGLLICAFLQQFSHTPLNDVLLGILTAGIIMVLWFVIFMMYDVFEESFLDDYMDNLQDKLTGK